MIVQTPSIVLHSRRYGDTSRIVVAYSRDLGKVTVMARGIRKPGSAFGSALEPLTESRLTIYYRRQRDMHTVSAAESIVPRRQLGTSYDHLAAGLAVAETVMRTQVDGEANAPVYDLLHEGFTLMDRVERPDYLGIALRLHLAALMGFGLTDGGPVDDGTLAVAIRVPDGLMLPERYAGTATTVRMSAQAYRILYTCLTQPLAGLPQAPIGQADRLEIEAFVSTYFSHHLDRAVSGRTYDVMHDRMG